MTTPPEKRFWIKVSKGSPDSCWLWTANHGLKDENYGRFIVNPGPVKDRRCVKAHRYAYELLIGSIPDNLTLDHLCHETLCVNPAHMELVTYGENARRMHEWRRWITDWQGQTIDRAYMALRRKEADV